jgi:hypothetical protein
MIQSHQLFGAGCVVIGVLITSGGALVACWLIAFVTELTDRPIPARGHDLARAGLILLGLSYILMGIATLFGWHWLIVPLAVLLIAELIYLPVRLVRLSGAQT